MSRIIYFILSFFIMIGVTFAGEKYAFNSHHKYKIGDKKNETYDFKFDLQTNKL